ncbi:MAG: hypothetical protein F6J86_06260 [Symploca sp. SIO1B1]|nr:hypothetical protein [Symploca sp. SIO1B1]
MRRDTPTFNETLNQLKTGSAKLWMLLVGVNQYQKPWNSLDYAVADCQGLEEALEKATEQFKKREFLVHHDSGNLPPTLEDVRESLQQIVSKANSLDVILFYFAGHGKIEKGSQEPFLCLADTQPGNLFTTGLALDEVLQQFQNCAACKQLVLLDACHSGGIISVLGKTRGEVEESEPDPIIGLARALREQATQSKGFCAILSCDQEQRSWEHPELEHGVFTYYLIEGFQGAAADKYGIIKDHNLHEFVHNRTKSWVRKNLSGVSQTPISFAMKSESIVLGLVSANNNKLKPDYSSYSYDERVTEYRKAIDREIHQQAALGKEIEEIQVLEDIINHKSRKNLQALNQELGLMNGDINSAEQSITKRYKDQLNDYKQKYIELLKQHYPLTNAALQQLQKSQERLKINSQIATAIREQLTQDYEQKFQEYREEFRIALYQRRLPPDEAHQELQGLQQELELSTAKVESIEAEVNADYQRDEQWCQQKLEEAIRQIYPLNSENPDELLQQQKRDLEQERGLNSITIASIAKGVVARYRQHLQYYRETYIIVKRVNSANNERHLLENLRQFIANNTTSLIEKEVDNEEIYEERFTKVIQHHYPNLPSDEFLENLRKTSCLSQEIIASIEKKVLENYGLDPSIISVEQVSQSSPPYSRKLFAWIASDCQDISQLLQGQELEETLNWLDTQNSRRLNRREEEFIRKSMVWDS